VVTLLLLLLDIEMFGSLCELLLSLLRYFIKLADLLCKAMSSACPLTQLHLLADPSILSLLV
jgi:hypothetical protein